MSLRQTFHPGPVSMHRVMGGVAAYLLIGVTWAFGYKLLMEKRPNAIHFQTFIGGIPTAEPSLLMYFSVSTLTSVGYGDAYPVHRIARSLATAEALIGQLYPAILIAMLRRAIELGVNFIDTADSYGPNVSEKLIADALAPYPDDLVIATKGGWNRPGPDQWTHDASPTHLRNAVEGSLSRLRLARID